MVPLFSTSPYNLIEKHLLVVPTTWGGGGGGGIKFPRIFYPSPPPPPRTLYIKGVGVVPLHTHVLQEVVKDALLRGCLPLAQVYLLHYNTSSKIQVRGDRSLQLASSLLNHMVYPHLLLRWYTQHISYSHGTTHTYLRKPIRAIHCNLRFLNIPFYNGNFHSTVKIFPFYN